MNKLIASAGLGVRDGGLLLGGNAPLPVRRIHWARIPWRRPDRDVVADMRNLYECFMADNAEMLSAYDPRTYRLSDWKATIETVAQGTGFTMPAFGGAREATSRFSRILEEAGLPGYNGFATFPDSVLMISGPHGRTDYEPARACHLLFTDYE